MLYNCGNCLCTNWVVSRCPCKTRARPKPPYEPPCEEFAFWFASSCRPVPVPKHRNDRNQCFLRTQGCRFRRSPGRNSNPHLWVVQLKSQQTARDSNETSTTRCRTTPPELGPGHTPATHITSNHLHPRMSFQLLD